MTLTPRVSVVIPVYNRGPMVKHTIDSALVQTLAEGAYEIIVVDDGSSDGTLDFLRRTYDGNPRVRLIAQPNRGVAAARNRGLSEARGEFIAYLDHDDLWLPEKLEVQLAALGDCPAAGVVYCRWLEVDEAGAPLPDDQQTTAPAWRPHQGRVYDVFASRNIILSMSVPLARTAALREAGGFDAGTTPCDDWDLWLRLARRHQFAFVDKTLVVYTHHPDQQSSDLAHMARAQQKLLFKHWPLLGKRPALLLRAIGMTSFARTARLYVEAKEALLEGRRKRALVLLATALARQPLVLLCPQWLYLAQRLARNDTSRY